MAEVMHFEDFKSEGSEVNCKVIIAQKNIISNDILAKRNLKVHAEKCIVERI